MQRVSQLLDPSHYEYSYRQALVRLWVLASDDQRLNSWEQQDNEATIAPHVAAFKDKLDNEYVIPAAEINAHPLALIRALDDYLNSVALSLSQSQRTGSSACQWEEEGKGYWLVPVTLQPRRQAAMSRQAMCTARWFHHHAVLPATTVHGIDVSTSLSKSTLDTHLEVLSKQVDGSLKVWIAHFNDGADVVWDKTSSPAGHWRAQSVDSPTTRSASVLQALALARDAGAHVVVFPEFTVDLNQRKELAQNLRLNPSGIQLVVAGAFHEPQDGDPAVTYNTAPVYNGHGSTIFTHRKLRLFGDNQHGTEHAAVGKSIHVLVTPIGCMTVLICKDFLDKHPSVDNLLAEVPVDWVWVPSFGDETTIKAHKNRAKELAKVTVGTSSAIAQTQNTAIIEPGRKPSPLPGFGHPAGQSSPVDVPTTGGLVEFSLQRQAPVPTKATKPNLTRIK